MRKQIHLAVSAMPEISAIYFALLQCGYDYYALERSAEHADRCRSFAGTAAVPRFFAEIRQNTCEVYPYWPRAAILEEATFHLPADHSKFRDYDAFRRQIMSAGNIADRERDERLWTWMEGFPAALSRIFEDEAFGRYLEWEREWIAGQNAEHADELRRLGECLEICVSRYGSPVREIKIVLNPIKCAYSADYYRDEDRFVFISGQFRLDSVVHEFLHPVVRQSVDKFAGEILRERRKYPGIDDSYYLSGDDAGFLNAFEEYAVREQTKAVMRERYPESLADLVSGLILKERKESV